MFICIWLVAIAVNTYLFLLFALTTIKVAQKLINKSEISKELIIKILVIYSLWWSTTMILFSLN